MDARNFAATAHAGQRYGTHPFTYHLAAVEATLRRFGQEEDQLLAAAWLHDILEDTPTTYEAVCDGFGNRIGELVRGVTDVRVDAEGCPLPNRRARQYWTYEVTREVAGQYPEVVLLKLADRIANTEASLEGGINAQHLGMYLTEHPWFCRQLGGTGYPMGTENFSATQLMWDALDKLIKKGHKTQHALPRPGATPTQ